MAGAYDVRRWCHPPIFITSLCQPFDDIGLVTHESQQSHDLFPTGSNPIGLIQLSKSGRYFCHTPSQHVALFSVLQDQHQFVDTVDFILDALNQGTKRVCDVIDKCIGNPIRGNVDIIFELFDPPPHILWVGCWAEVELEHLVRLGLGIGGKVTYGEGPFPENHYVHVDWIQMCRTVRILVETPETDEVVVAE